MSFLSITRGRQTRQTGATTRDAKTGWAAARRRLVIGCVLVANTLTFGVPAGAAEDLPQANLEKWLLRRLNEPTERERAHEREGNVYIYDGLTDRDVDVALNRHFDRIEYMMFVGTRRTDPAATAPDDAATESSGCGS